MQTSTNTKPTILIVYFVYIIVYVSVIQIKPSQYGSKPEGVSKLYNIHETRCTYNTYQILNYDEVCFLE